MDDPQTAAPPTPARRWGLRDAAWLVGLATVYFFAARFGLSLAIVHGSASSIWPPTGIALAALVVLGLRLWPAVLVGAFLANLDESGHAASSAAIAIGNTLEAVAGAYAVTRWAGGVQAFERPQGVFAFIGLAGLVAPAISASIGVGSLVAFGLAPAALADSIWLTWWLGDASGAIVLAPAVILLATPRPSVRVPARNGEAAACFALTTIVAFSIWGPWSTSLFSGRPFAFMSLPVVVWAALRLGPRLTALSALLIDSIAIAGTLEGYGPFILSAPNESLLYLQAFLGVIALVTLPTAALAQVQTVTQSDLRRAAENLEADVQARTASLAESEEALRRSLRSVAEAERVTGRGSWEWDVSADRAVWSEGMYRLFGVDKRTFVNSNENFLALVEPEDRERMGDAIAKALESPGRFFQEYRLRRPDGQLRYLQGEGNVVTREDGKPRTLFGVVQDVTDLHAAEEARAKLQQKVSESEARLRAIFENSPVGIILTRRDGTVIDVNRGAELLWGRSRADFFEPGFRTNQLFAVPAEREAMVEKVQAAGGARDLEIRMVRGDGQVRVMTFGVQVIQLDGEPAFLASGIDITPLRESEQRVQESESRLRAVLDNASDAIITGDASATIVGWNRAAERIFGLSAGQAIGRSIGTLLPPPQWAEYQADIAGFLQGKPSRYVGRPREMKGQRDDGTPIDVELSLAVWQAGAGPMFTGVVRDITERKRAEAEMRRATERFESVFRSSPVPISLTKDDGQFLDVNEAYCALVGRTGHDLLSGRVKAAEVWEDPEERQRMLIAIRERGAVKEFELRIKRPDGEVRTTLASLEYIDLGGATTILALLQDITERQKAQEERQARLQSEAELDRLRRTDRFRTEFINSTSHELRTPLTPLTLGVRTLAIDKRLDAGLRTTVETMQRSVARLNHLVDDMVGAADLQARNLALDKRRLNLTRELRAAVAAHQPAAERAGLTMQEPDDTGLTVSADAARLQLVLGHLLGNAIKFTPAGGKVLVASRREDDLVRVVVADTGIGLTSKQLDGLWKPFAQAHDKSQRTDSGSGLGLYVTKGIIELHGGEVGCSSPGPGKGSKFWFTLPLATGHIDPLAKGAKAPEAPAEPKRRLNPGVSDDE